MKIAFIYGGQGSQAEGMGNDLYVQYPFIREFYDLIDLDFPLKELSFAGDLATISKTEYTQPIMLAFQIAVTKVLKHYGIEADIVLGLSLGEYSALYAAGVLGEKELLEIIAYRGKEMSKASEKLDSKMLAVFSDDIERLEELCKVYSTDKSFAEISNINTKGQIVISGECNVVARIGEKLKAEGYKFRELNTSGPFHTSYMDAVSVNLSEYFMNIDFNTPNLPIIHNLYGVFKDHVDLKEAMSQQVNNPVLFKDSIEELLSKKPDLIVEIGYGNTIKGLVARMDKNYQVLAANSLESIEELIKEVEDNGQ